MATGVTKKNWSADTHIVSDETFNSDCSYQITYDGKADAKDVISASYDMKYKKVVGGPTDNRLYFGDNIDVMRYLLQKKMLSGKVKLIYIDPPYGTNSVFQSRHQRNSYKDDLVGSQYIEFMRRRLILLRELMADDGSIYVHLDGNMVFQIKLVMDEVFGPKNYRGFITRKKCSNKNSTRNTYGNISDYIVFYSKTDKYTWHRPATSWTPEKIKKEYPCLDEATGRRYKKVPIHAPGVRNGETGKPWRGMTPPQGKHWQYTPAKLDEFDARGDIYWSANANPRRKVYLDEDKGIPVQDIWLDVQDSLNQSIRITGYPTEKNPALLERIIKASTNEGDLVLDCFAGSGTTLDAAQHAGRKWIGIDNSSEAIANILKRFYRGLEEMGDYVGRPKANSTASDLFDEGQAIKEKIYTERGFDLYADSRYQEELAEIIHDYA